MLLHQLVSCLFFRILSLPKHVPGSPTQSMDIHDSRALKPSSWMNYRLSQQFLLCLFGFKFNQTGYIITQVTNAFDSLNHSFLLPFFVVHQIQYSSASRQRSANNLQIAIYSLSFTDTSLRLHCPNLLSRSFSCTSIIMCHTESLK